MEVVGNCVVLIDDTSMLRFCAAEFPRISCFTHNPQLPLPEMKQGKHWVVQLYPMPRGDEPHHNWG